MGIAFIGFGEGLGGNVPQMREGLRCDTGCCCYHGPNFQTQTQAGWSLLLGWRGGRGHCYNKLQIWKESLFADTVLACRFRSKLNTPVS